jgi:hypothetical protein
MNNKNTLAFLFCLFAFSKSVDAQLVISEKSQFWTHSSIGNQYIITIDHPEEYSFEADPEDNSGYTGRKNYDYQGKPYLYFEVEFILASNEDDGEGLLKYSPNPESNLKPGDFDSKKSDPEKGRDDVDYYGDVMNFFIDKDHGILFSTHIWSREEADVQALGLNYDEDRILTGKTARKAQHDLKMFLLKNLKVRRIGEASPVKSTAANQSDAGNQDVADDSQTPLGRETVNHFIQQPSNDWLLVVGGASALVAAVAVARRLLKAKPGKSAGKDGKSEPEKDKRQKKKQEYIYILQLNKNELEVGLAQNDKLVITAWQVDSAGNRIVAKDATIQVNTAEPNLSISSKMGNGQCVATLSLQSSGQFREAILTVKAMAGGHSLQASAKVKCNQPLTLIVDGPTPLTYIDGKKYQEALFLKQNDETNGKWVFKPFFIWFTNDPTPDIDPDRTKPVAPPFKPLFRWKVTPDILEISAPVYHSENVWKTEVKLIGETPADTNWLFTDGKIKIDITVEEQKIH